MIFQILLASYLLLIASILLYNQARTFLAFLKVRADDKEACEETRPSRHRCFRWIKRQYEITKDKLLPYCGLDTLTLSAFSASAENPSCYTIFALISVY